MIITDGTQQVEIAIPSYMKKIGVNCSGGADSAILLYAIADYVKNNMPDSTISVVTCSNDLKHRWNGRKAADVINYIVEKLDFHQFDMHYVYYRDEQAVQYFHDVEGKLFADGRIDMLASGITQKPMIGDTTIEDIDGKIINLRDKIIPGRETPNETIWTLDKRFWNPFANIDKKMIAALYDHYGVRDELFPMTRSCEAKPGEGVAFDPDFEKKHCGKCWWCLERKWAFGALE